MIVLTSRYVYSTVSVPRIRDLALNVKFVKMEAFQSTASDAERWRWRWRCMFPNRDTQARRDLQMEHI